MTSRKNIDPSLEKLFNVSSHGFRLEDRHFYAVYKTRLLKYDGQDVGERGHGNIVSFTRLFTAKDEEDAKSVATMYFDLSNPTFSTLNRTKVERSENFLLEIKEYVPPTFSKENFRKFNKLEHSPTGYLLRYCKVYKQEDDSLPASFHGFEHCSMMRSQRHLNSSSATAYYYHPWHGAGDIYDDWYRYDKTSRHYTRLENEFNKRFNTEAKKFARTEYTSLNKEEQELIRRYKRLESIDNQFHELIDDETFLRRDLMQGRFFNQYGELVFEPDEYNYLRQVFLGREDKVSEARIKIQELEIKRNMIEHEIMRLQKFIDGDE